MHEYQHLYDVPLSTLELSERSHNALYRTGIETVGDAIDTHIRATLNPPSVRGATAQALLELKPALIEKDYGKYI